MPINAPVSFNDARQVLEVVRRNAPENQEPGEPSSGDSENNSKSVSPQEGNPLRRYRWNPVAGYVAAVLLTAAACALTFAVRAVWPALTPQPAFFICSIVAASWFGGFLPGVLASLLSILCAVVFFSTGKRPWEMAELVRLFLNFLSAVGISWLGGLQRRDEAALLKGLTLLEERVRERTADIRSINTKLSREVSQRIRAQEEMLRLNRALRVRGVCNRSMLRARREGALLDKICRGIVKNGEYRLAAFYSVPSDGEDGELQFSPDGLRHVSRAFSGREPAWSGEEFEFTLMREAIRTRRPQICLDLPDKTPETPWRQWTRSRALRSLAVLPMATLGGNIGVLLIYSDDPEDFDRRETALLQMVANDVARGVALLRFREARRLAEEALEAREAELAKVARTMVVGELTASIAHELNQPLTAVITGASACRRWLESSPPNLEEARAALQRITRDGNRAAEIMQRVRKLFTRSRGATTRETTSVNDVVHEILTLTRGELRRREVELKCDFAEGLPEVEMDRSQIQQVLTGLVMNGLDAMEPVKDRTRVLSVRTGLLEPGTIVVEVADNGYELEEEQRERLFEAFYAIKARGQGMGLFIIRSIIESHGGRLWAEANAEGRGMTFRFTLPATNRKEEPV